MHPDGGPFNTISGSGVFQPARADNFPDVFSSGSDVSQPSPEAVRLQEEQKAHMDSFKQLWDIDQSPAAVVSAPSAAPNVSSSVFGLSQNPQPALNPLISQSSALSGRPNTAPVQPTVTSERNAVVPPHADFAPPQRAF
jgi:hypothetical protein